MDGSTFWQALALFLVFEGLMPFLSPKRWRVLVAQVARLEDGQIRFIGLLSMVCGLVCLWLLA